jgi:hypothetical protein
MALTSTERSQLLRRRKREEQAAKLLTPAGNPSYLKTPFSAFVSDRTFELYENLDAFGVVIDGSTLGDDKQRFRSQVGRDEPLSSLERAIGLVDVFIDAARELADQINAYKLIEIDRSINEAVEQSANLPRGDVEALKKSFAKIEALKAIRSQLQKPTRHTVAAIRASGE